MASASEKTSPIIIKRGKKGHGGHHGGSWKVAYADFVTAMMAFFLLMWLLNMASPELKAELSKYFNEFSFFTIFERGGGALESSPDTGLMPKKLNLPEKESPVERPNINPEGKEEILAEIKAAEEQFKSELQEEIEKRLGDLKDQVLIDSFEEGVRIQLIDKQGSPMFPLGSAGLTDIAINALKIITERLAPLNNRIAIEGHTDAKPYPSNRFTNWELSMARASAARQEMERFGLSLNRLVRVAGYSSVEPLIKEDPNDPRNRRISILVYDRLTGPGRNGLVKRPSPPATGSPTTNSTSTSTTTNGATTKPLNPMDEAMSKAMKEVGKTTP